MTYSTQLQRLFASLDEHQVAAVNVGSGLACVVGNPGCLDGETTYLSFRRYVRRRGCRRISLRDLYLKFNGLRTRRRAWDDLSVPVDTHSINSDGVVYLNRIHAVISTGTRHCVRIIAEDGTQLVCTDDHPVLTTNGYVAARDIKGCVSLALGSMRPRKGGGKKKRPGGRVEVATKFHPHGNMHVVRAVARMRQPKDYSYKRVMRARLVVEAHMNGVPYAEFVQALKTDAKRSAKFKYLDPALEVHHKDEDRSNDAFHNLQVLSKEEHSRLHGKSENFNVEYCVTKRMVAVEDAGMRDVYDVRMAGPDHNFTGNGFFVHNSGKTRTVVARIARLVADGLPADQILAMTFTRAAAAEMEERLERLGIGAARIGTIHSVCRQIVAVETGMLTGKLDEKGVLGIELKKFMGEMRKKGLVPNYGMDIEGVERFIEACKSHGPCFVFGDPFNMNDMAVEYIRKMAKKWALLSGVSARNLELTYNGMEKKRAELQLYSFDDMLLWCWMQLVSSEASRNRWRNRWSVVMVDECQDSNPVQWDVARLLVGLDSCVDGITSIKPDDGLHNLMIVGDTSQSVYGWRSAEPSLFTAFAKRADVQNFVLPINYRSNQTICAVAGLLVKGRQWHLGGDMQSLEPDEFPRAVTVKRYEYPEQEAEDVISSCEQIARTKGWRSCAVLSRLKVGLDLAEIACIRRRIKYIKMASGSFFESKEVRDILAYMRVASGLDPDGRWAKHIINKPFRFIGAAFIGKAQAWARDRNVSILDGLEALSDELNYKQQESIRQLYDLLQRLNMVAVGAEKRYLAAADELVQRKRRGELGLPDDPIDYMRETPYGPGPAEMILTTIQDTRYIDDLQREEGLFGLDESRVAALEALRRMATQFPTVNRFLGYIDALTVAVAEARRSGLKLKEDSREDALVLSTIHRAKGLEFKHVFLVDVTKGRFPCSKSGDMEEELRLLYVAITRAIETCQVSCVSAADLLRSEENEAGAAASEAAESSYIGKVERAIASLEKRYKVKEAGSAVDKPRFANLEGSGA